MSQNKGDILNKFAYRTYSAQPQQIVAIKLAFGLALDPIEYAFMINHELELPVSTFNYKNQQYTDIITTMALGPDAIEDGDAAGKETKPPRVESSSSSSEESMPKAWYCI